MRELICRPHCGVIHLSSEAVFLCGTAEGVRVVLIAGHPLREAVTAHGPLIMNSQEQIASAIERYQAGTWADSNL